MTDTNLLAALLDSLKAPLLFADTEHVIRYMNRAATAHYEQGEALLGTSLLDCHNETSQAVIVETLKVLQAGAQERLTSDNPDQRIYMRAVRAADGRVLGYYERYEPLPE